MAEKQFVDQLIKTIHTFGNATVLRCSDSHTLGIPDLLAWIPRGDGTWSLALEAKEIKPLMKDPDHKGRRTGQMLKHAFTGPQISMMRSMMKSGVDVFGIVRVSMDTAFRFEPRDINAKTGNFTYEEMVKFGKRVHRRDGVWRFWNNETDIHSSRY